jgi:hypothetical protein
MAPPAVAAARILAYGDRVRRDAPSVPALLRRFADDTDVPFDVGNALLKVAVYVERLEALVGELAGEGA